MLAAYASNVVANGTPPQFNSTKGLSLGQANNVLTGLLAKHANVVSKKINLSYGSLMQSPRAVSAGSSLFYLGYDNANNVTVYNVSVVKAVPELKVKIDRVVVDSSTSTINLLGSSYVRSGNKLFMLPTYSVSPLLFSSVLGENHLNYTYSLSIGGQVVASGNQDTSNFSKQFNFKDIPSSQPMKLVFEAAGNANYTPVDPTVFYTTANANLVISSATTLSNDLVCGSLTINSGTTLTTNGFSILCNSTITNSGTIATGNPASNSGTSFVNSYAGSGGGGGSTGGGSTAGSSPTQPTITNGNIVTWYTGGFTNYLTAGSGGVSGSLNPGGSGSFGVYIQANKITAGTVNAVGLDGLTGASTGKLAGGHGGNTLNLGGVGGASGHSSVTTGGGGGGGGVIMFAYGCSSGCYTAGTYTTTAGAGGSGAAPGSAGGNGAVDTFNFAGNAPILVLPQPTATCVPVISNTLINFGTVLPGSFAPTANAEKVTNGGSTASYIVLYSTSTTTGNWVSGSLSFLVGNTLWSSTSGQNIGTQLTNTITTNTAIYVGSSASNNIFFGVNVPTGQAVATYTQGMTVSLSC